MGETMPVVDVEHLGFNYGRVAALRDVTFTVPQGALYALLGPNGSGKTTLLQVLGGMRRAKSGRASVLGADPRTLSVIERAHVGYIAEGQSLPGWMTLEQLEKYLAPLYPRWDDGLARSLREQFDLDAHRPIRTLSRGQHMKAALLCALAPRPKLLIMDEPFTGMDALVKDELVRGLLESAGTEGWTVLLCSHDIGELEMLADWVGFLASGRMVLSEPMDSLKQHYRHVEITGERMAFVSPQNDWLGLDQAGHRMSFILPNATAARETVLSSQFAPARVEVRDATLREIFVALARTTSSRSRSLPTAEVAA
jgi:ABC-2 type transport system ATP-binding protein